MKVKKSDFSNKEQELDQVMLRLRHPLTGIYQFIQRSPSSGSSSPSSTTTASTPTTTNPSNVTSAPNSASTNTNIQTNNQNSSTSSFKIPEEEIIPFKGSDLLRWLTANNYPDVDKMAQLLLGFKYICPITEIDSHTSETFSPESLYRFQVYK
jgi:hypothetical protein